MNRQRALTLLELLSVTLLLGVTAVLVTVRLHSATGAARLRGATLQLEQTMRTASVIARRRHEPVWFVIECGSGRYALRTSARPPAEWRHLDGVIATRFIAGSELRSAQAHGALTVRVSPSGAVLPWKVELRAGALVRTVWYVGYGEGLSSREGSIDDCAERQ